MAVEKRWIRNTILTIASFLLLFVLLQIALSATVNVLNSNIETNLNSSIEFACMALFVMPSIWLGYAAAMSRHRGIYIALTVMISLSILSCIGFLVYEGYVYGSVLSYYSSILNVPLVQGLMISKLVCWSVITALLLAYLGIAIAGDCSRPPPEFKYVSHYNQQPMLPMPPEYVRHVNAKPLEPMREYPRMIASPPVRYGDYSGSPRQYYTAKY